MPIKNIVKKNQIFVFVFIHKITSKNMQNLTFFVKKNEFTFKRITKKYNTKILAFSLKNSNYVLENKCQIDSQQLQNLLSFLKQNAIVHGVFFKNQILNNERIFSLETQIKLDLWKQINSLNF